jgi:hypothetical protein
MDRSIRTLPSILHIPVLAINLISIIKMDNVGVKKSLRNKLSGWFEEKWCCRREFGLELCIRCREALLVMGEIVPLFLRLELNKKKIL